MANQLTTNQDLVTVGTLTSPDGRFKFTMQTDGNLVLYGPNWEALWSSGTFGNIVSQAIMQGDGNFVIYGPGSVPIWSSGTFGHPGAWLSVQNDGNVVIYGSAAAPLWAAPAPFIDVKKLVTQLIDLKAANPTKKIAFVFSGGGARAAWFGGVIEAIEREVRQQQPTVAGHRRFAPDLLVGTSGGGLSAVGYFADLLNSGTYGSYTNRQSWLWREVSRKNEAALKLFDNPGVLELLSGSGTGKGQLDWATILDKPIGTFLNIANIPESLSPTYNFNVLFKCGNEIGADVKLIEQKWKALYSSLGTLVADAKNITLKLPQNVSATWSDATNTIVLVQDTIAIIRDQVDGINSGLAAIRNNISNAHFKAAADAFINLFSTGGGIVVKIFNLLVKLHKIALQIPVGAISSQFSAFETLFKDIKKVLEGLVELNKTFGNTIGDITNALLQLSLKIDDVIRFIVLAGRMMEANSSLMNTTGLKNCLHEVLRLALPTTFAKEGAASDLDDAIFKHWKTQRDAKIADPMVRAPELILTASNITANRLALLTVCDGETAQNLTDLNRWVIGLNLANSGFIRGTKLNQGKQSNPISTKDPLHWIFGAWANDFVPPPQPANPDWAVLNAPELVGNSNSSGTANPIITVPKTRELAKTPAGCPFEQMPGISLITGTSVIAAAALTTSAIPIAFPPRYWRFENPFLKKPHFHWFVDGGLCDNRPIQQALDAGADVIVSFEVSPLRKAFLDIPTFAKKPNIMGVISALTDTQINSAFNRFLETWVGQNPNSQTKLWRIAPEVGPGKEDETIGVYDFNGYWNKGVMKMGLFDWFMRGYLDSKTIPVPGKTDPVLDAYQNIPEYGQLGNAAQKSTSPGFFIVDFENNKPHPVYPY